MKYNIGFMSKSKVKTILQYVVCVLIIEVLIVAINIIKLSVDNKNVVVESYTEVSNINSTQMKDVQTIGNAKIAILDYNELNYYIKVNLKEQNVTIYTMDENGQYTIPVRKTICSTGVSTPTQGVFEISDKYEWAYLVGNVYGQYATRITGPILFHSVPYTSQNKSSLEYWEFDKLGQPVSKGCVRLTVEDAKWIFDHCKEGTQVEFCYENGNDNTVKEETQMKISEYDDELRGWDPTDPDPKNPWIEFKKQNERENEEL